jgi:prepilin-type N-terminal cleavage/methylation domain-containing protein
MKIKTTMSSAFTLVEIMIVVAIIGLLCSMVIPNYVKARSNSQQTACINNLRQIDGAAQTYALENKLTSSDVYTLSELFPYLRLTSSGNIPACPAGGIYTPGATISNAPTCTVSGHALP